MKKSWYTSVMVGGVPAIPAAVAVVGVAMVAIGGYEVRHYYNTYKLCRTTFGRLSQVYSGFARHACDTAQGHIALGEVLVVVGLVALALGVILLVKGRSAAPSLSDMALSGAASGPAFPGPTPEPLPYGTSPFDTPSSTVSDPYASPMPTPYSSTPTASSGLRVPPVPTPLPASPVPPVASVATPALKGKLARPSPDSSPTSE